MPRPQRSTKDAWLDTFADWSAETQESMLDTCEMLHRQTKRRTGKRQDEDAIEARAEAKAQPAAKAATGQQSLGGLPDEDQKL